MPIHDWARVGPGTFHAFHLGWLFTIASRLNAGVLPPDHYALPEQYVRKPEGEGQGPEGDVVAPQLDPPPGGWGGANGGAVALLDKPTARFVQTRDAEAEGYARHANHLAIHNEFGRTVAVTEVVSPGNKSGRRVFTTFADKCADLLGRGVNLLVIDLFPPGGSTRAASTP